MSTAAPSTGPGRRWTSVLAGFIGNVVEWYDFALYGYMAGIIAPLFFPDEDKFAALIATYGIFAAGFLMRPIGAAFFGWLGDTVGRAYTMLISVTLMALPTLALGLLPTHASVGIWAPILLIAVRLVQGLSVGGEFSSSVTYLVETAPPGKRGFASSWANSGSMTGMLLGSGAAALTTGILDNDALMAWGWRMPFLFGGLLGLVAIGLRRNLPKSQVFLRHHQERGPTSPLLQAFTTNRAQTLKAVVFSSGYAATFYLALVYLPEWIEQQTDVPRSLALRYNTFATALSLVVIPLSGMAGDRWIRRNHLIAASFIALGIVAWPIMAWIQTGSLTAAFFGQLILAGLLAIPLGSAPATYAEMFPAEDRLSGYAMASNIGSGLVGGTTPMLATWFISQTGAPIAPAIQLLAMALVAAIILMTIPDRSREPLL